MLSLEIDEQDAAEITARVERQRSLREAGSLREPDPAVPVPVAQWQEENAKRLSTYHFTCKCTCPIVTRAKTGTCPNCARLFELF